jgi:hypothetical protein
MAGVFQNIDPQGFESASIYGDPGSSFHFTADLDLSDHFNTDPDPHQSYANLRPLTADPPQLYFKDSTALL